MEDLVISVLITAGLLQLVFYILIEVDIRVLGESDATMSGISVTWIPIISIMLPFLGIGVQLWYFSLRVQGH